AAARAVRAVPVPPAPRGPGRLALLPGRGPEPDRRTPVGHPVAVAVRGRPVRSDQPAAGLDRRYAEERLDRPGRAGDPPGRPGHAVLLGGDHPDPLPGARRGPPLPGGWLRRGSGRAPALHVPARADGGAVDRPAADPQPSG